MKCAWFFIASYLFVACFTDAVEEKCDVVTYGTGKYDVKKECWEEEPTTPKLEVDSTCQSLKIRKKILRALKCRPGIQKFLAQKSYDCEPSKLSHVGFTNICPSKMEYVTTVVKNSKTCYVVFPNRQCITYSTCDYYTGCSKNTYAKSACLPDRFRYFNIWVYCPDTHQFEFETLELPQCCACREYQLCLGSPVVPGTP